MRDSLYWDDFLRRADETVDAIKNGVLPPVRRVAVFVTNKCNFRCKYCNHRASGESMSQSTFESILERYGDSAIIHITGGEPSTVRWLYPFLEQYGNKYRFHLNTNAYVTPPAGAVRRLKISLDSTDAEYWSSLVGRNDAFDVVLRNIKYAAPRTVTSITYTLTHENYALAPKFAKFIFTEAPELYAVFFSVYKGVNKEYSFREEDATDFFTRVLPELESVLPSESLALMRETIDEKRRLVQGARFLQSSRPCYISMSERVFSPAGVESACSHLYRDGVCTPSTEKHSKCLYGCNQRLVQFNELVEAKLSAQ